MNYKLALTSFSILASIAISSEVSAASIHSVKSGDTLYSIARNYNLSLADLKSLNNITSDNIYVGQKLVTSKSTSTTVTSVPKTSTSGTAVTSTTNTKVVNASLLNVRSGAGTTYKILGAVSKNAQVNVVSVSNGWSKISFKDGYGFVSSSYLSDLPKVTTTTTTTTTTTNTSSNVSTSTPNKVTTNVNSATPAVTYTVKAGDTLYRIAISNSITVDNLKEINNLSSNSIFVGQKLTIKEGTTNSTVSENGYAASYNIFIQPTEGVLTSPFGYRIHPITKNYALHKGVDIAKVGIVNVVAASDGTVIRSGVTSGYGQYIVISHSINGKQYTTLYAHLRENSRLVLVGDKVKVGQNLALMGSTGESTGQHLHFEIHEGAYNAANTKVVDPLNYIKLKK